MLKIRNLLWLKMISKVVQHNDNQVFANVCAMQNELCGRRQGVGFWRVIYGCIARYAWDFILA